MTARNRTILALAAMLTALLVLPAAAVAQGAEDPAFGKARESGEIASYTISKVQRWLHEVALKKIEPDTGLYHPDGNFNYQDAWADCYPFLVWAAWLTDLDALKPHVEQVLRNLAKPAYQNHPWEGNSIDGFADSVEGGIYVMNRLPVPEGLAWADREVATNIVYAQDKDKLWGTMKLQSNGVRTAIIHALMHTRGLIARPWQQDLKLGASQTTDGVAVVIKVESKWSGKLWPSTYRDIASTWVSSMTGHA